MWKSNKEEQRPAPSAASPSPVTPVVTAPPLVAKEKPIMEAPKPDNYRADVAHIGKSVLVKGELSGSEDLYLDGEVEGSIDLKGHSLTIGPHGRVRANVHARDVVVHGKVEGNLRAAERVELKKTAVLMGDIFTQRIMIEEGAFFKGGIDIQKEPAKGDAKVETRPEPKREVPPPVAAYAPSASVATAAGAGGQSTLLDQKKY
jgi:cytoskeletal protein CcmA (bactofilin family)